MRVRSPDGQGEEALPQSLCSGRAGAEALARRQTLEKFIIWVVNVLQDLPGSDHALPGVDLLLDVQC